MLMLDFLAEQKIAEAVSRGELDQLPGQGRPLALDDDPLMPEDLRVAYRILKNGGIVPAEVEALNEIAQLERFVAAEAGGDAAARAKALKKLALLRTRIESRYYEQALRKLST
jgi:DnaJ-like protein